MNTVDRQHASILARAPQDSQIINSIL